MPNAFRALTFSTTLKSPSAQLTLNIFRPIAIKHAHLSSIFKVFGLESEGRVSQGMFVQLMLFLKANLPNLIAELRELLVAELAHLAKVRRAVNNIPVTLNTSETHVPLN